MNLVELEARLKADGFNMKYIVLNRRIEYGGNDLHCIEERGGRWVIYYFERGVDFNERVFPTESEACEAFWAWVGKAPYLKMR